MPTALQRIVKATRARFDRWVDAYAAPYENRDVNRGYRPEEVLHVSISPTQSLSDARDIANGRRPPTEEYGDIPISIWAEWTVQSIRNSVTQHAVGVFGNSGLLCEGMLADDRVQSATNGRTKGVTKCDVMLKPAPLPDGQSVAAEIAEVWEEIFPEEIMEQALFWMIFVGFFLAEIIWEPRIKTDRWMPRLKVWHPLTIYYDVSRRRYVAITTEGSIYIEEDDPKWFLFTPWGQYRGWLRGAVRSVSIPWVIRQYALRDWARFSEVHGLPIKALKVPAQASSADKARFFASVRNLGAETNVMLPQQVATKEGGSGANFDFGLIEAKDRAWEAFPGLRDACDSSITLAIRGTNLTTEVDGGSYAAAESHRDEDSDFAMSDRKKLATAIRQRLLRLYAFYNWGNADLAPRVRLVGPTPDRLDKPSDEAKAWGDVADAVDKLEGRGWPVDRPAVAKRFEIPTLEKSEVDSPEPTSESRASLELEGSRDSV